MISRIGFWHFVASVVVVAIGGLLMPDVPCADGPAAKPTAVATIFSYYDALRAIGGPDVNCVILLPARQSPHEYEPTVKDRATVAKAA